MCDRIHVYPVNDLLEHDMSIMCWCNPTSPDGSILVHNSFDGRELSVN